MMLVSRPTSPETPSLVEALVPVAALVGLLGLSFFLFGDAAASGPNQIALLFCVIVATFVGWRRGHSIEALRDAGTASVTTGLSSIFILLAVGALIGTWAMSGTLVAMVYYGLQLLNPDYFYVTARSSPQNSSPKMSSHLFITRPLCLSKVSQVVWKRRDHTLLATDAATGS